MTLAINLTGREKRLSRVLRRLEDAGCGALRMKEGSRYSALYRLEEQGCLATRWEEGNNDRRGPQRKLYKITRKGKRKLDRGRQQWSLFVSIIGGIVQLALAWTLKQPHVTSMLIGARNTAQVDQAFQAE